MVFFGSRASTIKSGRISNVTCPSCNTQTHMSYSVFGKYAHVYWIPLFPIGKKVIVECNHCKKTDNIKDFTEQIKSKYDLEKSGNSYPIWYFSGLALIAGLIAFGAYTSKQHDKDVAEYITSPQIGDVYTLESNNRKGYHYAIRINTVTNDSVTALVSNMEYDTKKLKELNKDSNFSDVNYTFSKEELLKLYEEEIIEDINRD